MDKTIALYMRLSDEDDNLAAHEESNSISHQRKLMLDHIQKLPELKDCNIMEFSDDGYSGADFSRPNFVKMMDLVKAGKIQVIVTKDYSRLGRDYLEVGNYIESLITEKQETLDMQKDLFLDAKQEQLTKLSKLDEFDEEVIRYLIDYVLVYDNEHIEIRWNFDDFQAG